MPPRNHVAERLRELLSDEHVAPGERLPPERELAAQLGVSRSSLREGLRRLSDLGIIESRQGSGTYRAPLDLGDLFEVRRRLEPLAARLAATRRDAHDLRLLDEAVAEMRAALPDANHFGDADVAAHAAIVEASGSVPLRVLFSAIADLLRHSRTSTASDPALRTLALEEMGAIVGAIDAGDGDAAEQAMHAHLQHVGASVGAG
ncbi:FadR/GntR family transcriptional regulator [Conexibacter sp. JD483]|uniref:FadR/GntR family transcriptional regulator n=1 Tax=unclassified Conexibacter TaxID=2627773 RepID=UPI0027205883|nr:MULTISPECIES: FadR/GntR family transcriptional regulator [unclassified Conexibacter]MDO8186399.1 FadR/GntR family transcriptional regulator [Conexibacter sp. CPCC 205706]MDO8199798.1 FadR/GntR family transcriptional regulator [Conexibacter sp. CPCC 205762]MDR9369182.1 FadR/GntR family transcriptional regulator [Conexibacter sp. JD483]